MTNPFARIALVGALLMTSAPASADAPLDDGARDTPAAEGEAGENATEPGVARPPRMFRLSFGMGVSHGWTEGRDTTWGLSSPISFYVRTVDWLSIGLRIAGGFGYSSIEGAIVDVSFGLPSLALSFRESLGTAAALEVGMHADLGMQIFFRENAPYSDTNRVRFGPAMGVFAILELGVANGLMLDYTVEAYGLDGVDFQILGHATLSYVLRLE